MGLIFETTNNEYMLKKRLKKALKSIKTSIFVPIYFLMYINKVRTI